MNRHFEDSFYHLKRAGVQAKLGVKLTVRPMADRISDVLGREQEPEPTRVERVRDRLSMTVDRVKELAKSTYRRRGRSIETGGNDGSLQ